VIAADLTYDDIDGEMSKQPMSEFDELCLTLVAIKAGITVCG
jgi:hypothetical protein